MDGMMFCRLPFPWIGMGGGAMGRIVDAVDGLRMIVGRLVRRSLEIFGCVGVTVRLLTAFEARSVSLCPDRSFTTNPKNVHILRASSVLEWIFSIKKRM